jgi:hypothetical protein
MGTLVTHEPIFRTFVNGFQITFPNQFTVIVKNGPGAKCTQTQKIEDTAEMFLATRLGGGRGPDIEVEIYSPQQENISYRFGEKDSLGCVTPLELVNILYIVSSLRNESQRIPGTGFNGKSTVSRTDKETSSL